MKSIKLISLILTFMLLITALPLVSSAEISPKAGNQRKVYLHAQQTSNPQTTNVSQVNAFEQMKLYLAVDDPNKGEWNEETKTYENEFFNLNGYTVKIYFDPAYFQFVPEKAGDDWRDNLTPIEYTTPNVYATNGDRVEEDPSVNPDEDGKHPGADNDEVLDEEGFQEYAAGTCFGDGIKTGTEAYAYATVFFWGVNLPRKPAGNEWYNICALPLIPIRTGETNVRIDFNTQDPYTLELFAKGGGEKNFTPTVENGGVHRIIIGDKAKPDPPIPAPMPGVHSKNSLEISLSAPECAIYYTLDGTEPKVDKEGNPASKSTKKYTAPFTTISSVDVKCIAVRDRDGAVSDTATYEYELIPPKPVLFDNDKNKIPNIYSEEYDENSTVENGGYTVWVSDSDQYNATMDTNDIYYTFSETIDSVDITVGKDPDVKWVLLDKGIELQKMDVTEKKVVRLITYKKTEKKYSEVATYYLGIKPLTPVVYPEGGDFMDELDVTISCLPEGANIYYTLNGDNPKENGILYTGPINISKDTLVTAVAELDGEWSEIVKNEYNILSYTGNITAFYPPGQYEGEVYVSLDTDIEDGVIRYSDEGVMKDYNPGDVIVLKKDTILNVKVYDEDGEEVAKESFEYKVKPLPPVFSPEGTSFSDTDTVLVYAPQSITDETANSYELWYTLDGSDPTDSQNENRKKADDRTNYDTLVQEISKTTTIKAAVLRVGGSYSDVVEETYFICSTRPSKPVPTLAPGEYILEIGDENGFDTLFENVPLGTEIYYTIGDADTYFPDPDPLDIETNTIRYTEDKPIELEGNTVIKAIAINGMGQKSEVGVLKYTIIPETPVISGGGDIQKGTLIPVSAISAKVDKADEGEEQEVKSVIKYTVTCGDETYEGEFVNDCTDGDNEDFTTFYIDPETGNAYRNNDKTEEPLAKLDKELEGEVLIGVVNEYDGVESEKAEGKFNVTDTPVDIIAPYATPKSGTYEETVNPLKITLSSVYDDESKIEWREEGYAVWKNYALEKPEFTEDTILYIRTNIDSVLSEEVVYFYYFVPLAPVFDLPSGIYTEEQTVNISYDENAPEDKKNSIYSIYLRQTDWLDDVTSNTGFQRVVDTSKSFRAFVKNNETGRISERVYKNYILEDINISAGNVFIRKPFDVDRIKGNLLEKSPYADGIFLDTENKSADIYYQYEYVRRSDKKEVAVNNVSIFDESRPIMPVNMSEITIYAWLVDDYGTIAGSYRVFTIEFYYTKTPSGGGGGGGGATAGGATIASKYTKDIFGNEHPTHIKYINGYPDGSVQPDGFITREETAAILYRITNHSYDKPFVSTGEVFPDVPKDRWSVMNVEYMAGENVIMGYPDGEFKPAKNLTRAEFAALIHRFIKVDEAFGENPFEDVSEEHWAYKNILTLVENDIIKGYEDGSFRPENNITRAEVMTVINKILGRKPVESYVKSLKFNPYNDLNEDKWYYVTVLEATITHNYYLDGTGFEQKWEDWK